MVIRNISRSHNSSKTKNKSLIVKYNSKKKSRKNSLKKSIRIKSIRLGDQIKKSLHVYRPRLESKK